MIVLDDISVDQGLNHLRKAILFLNHYFDVSPLKNFEQELIEAKRNSYLHKNDEVIILTNTEKGKIKSRLKKIVVGHYIGWKPEKPNKQFRSKEYMAKYRKLIEQCDKTVLPDELIFSWIKLSRRNMQLHGKGTASMVGDLETALNDHLKTLFLEQFILQNETN